MADALRHRGPDGGRTWCDVDAGITLGHRRLAILDLSPVGSQPMPSPSGRFVTVFNGEIYNHLDLRRELDTGGPIAWQGHSDTETLVHGIERWGLAATLERAVGMWAVAVWDRQQQQLELARDRLGEKPLFWGWGAQGLVFGSELKALKVLPGFENPVDEQALALYLRYSYVPTPYSILRNIYKLEPGVVATISASALNTPPPSPPTAAGSGQFGGIRFYRYWSLDAVVSAGSDETMGAVDAVDGLEAHLTEAVRIQSVADVPLGAFLSGGVDSSLIAALMRTVSSNVRTFTIGFTDAGFNEAPYARAIAKHIGSTHSELYVRPADVVALVPQLPTIYDEPFADSSQLPTILLCRLARAHVTVALSGDGGDELFGGYNRYLTANLMQRCTWLPGPVRAIVGQGLTAIPARYIDRFARAPGIPRIPLAGLKAHKLGQILQSRATPRQQYGLATRTWTGPIPLFNCPYPLAPVDETTARRAGAPEQMMQWDMTSYLPDDILCKVDRAAMSASLETRVPFLDHRVVEYAWRMPIHHKLHHGAGKWAVRQLLSRHIPSTLIDRPKAGFAIPIGAWLRGPLREWADSLLDALERNSSSLLDIAAIRARWREHLAGSHDQTTAIWNVLMFQAWHNEWSAPYSIPAAD